MNKQTEAVQQERHPRAENPWESIRPDRRAQRVAEVASWPVRGVIQLYCERGDPAPEVEYSLALKAAAVFEFVIPAGATQQDAVVALKKILSAVEGHENIVEWPTGSVFGPPPSFDGDNLSALLRLTSGLVLKMAEKLNQPTAQREDDIAF